MYYDATYAPAAAGAPAFSLATHPPHPQVKLDALHAMMRITRCLSRKHGAYRMFCRRFQDVLFMIHGGDYASLQQRLLDEGKVVASGRQTVGGGDCSSLLSSCIGKPITTKCHHRNTPEHYRKDGGRNSRAVCKKLPVCLVSSSPSDPRAHGSHSEVGRPVLDIRRC